MAEIAFTHPMYLWLLLTIPLIIASHFYLLKHSRKKALMFANFETIRRVTGKKLLTKNIFLLTTRLIIVTLSIFAVAGATLWYEGYSNNNNFVIAIDISASMTTEDLQPTRLESAKQHAIKFVDLLESDAKIGVVSFSGITFINKPLTKNKDEVKRAIESLEVAEIGGTDLSGALITSTNLLSESKKGKTIILLTDGSSTAGAFINEAIRQGIEYAQNNHIIIYTIGTGTKNEEPLGYLPEYYNISSVYNEKNLQDISSQTEGEYFFGANNQNIVDAFSKISEDSEKAILHIDLGLGLIMIALVMLFFEWGLIQTRFKRKP